MITSPAVTSLFCPSSSCRAIQPIKITKSNYFDILGVKTTFDMDYDNLEAVYKTLQMELHPDKFGLKSREEQAISAENSSLVNIAYQVLAINFFLFFKFQAINFRFRL